MVIGDLRHRITLQKFITEVNENGFETEVWQDYKTVWASVSHLSGKEYYQAAAVQAEKTIRFLVRYAGDTSMRILFRNTQYSITSADNIKYENRFIEIKAVEVEKSG